MSNRSILSASQLTGRSVLLPAEDAQVYSDHIQRFKARYKPEGEQEVELVQSLADTQWRLDRVPVIESGIYAMGHREFADLFKDDEPAVRSVLIQTKTFLTYQRQLNNLSVQENRLRRQFEKDEVKLKEVQEERERRKRKAEHDAATRKKSLTIEAEEYLKAEAAGEEWDYETIEGHWDYVFTLDEVIERANEIRDEVAA